MSSFSARVVRPAIHVAWFASAVLAWHIFLAAIPRGYALHFTGAGIDVPVDAPTWYVAAMSFAQGAVSILAAVVSLGLAALLFWKRRQEPMTLFVSFYLLAYGSLEVGPLDMLDGFLPLIPWVPTQSGIAISADAPYEMSTALFVVMLLLFYVFPNGRFVPAWTRYAALLLLLLVPASVRVFSADWPSAMTPFAWIMFGALAILAGAGFYAQIYRYRHVATPVERQQSKWVMFGLLLTVVILAVPQTPFFVVLQSLAGVAGPWWRPLGGLSWILMVSILPLSLAIAVMRYRLWDIDIIINRTLVYGALTAGIVALYILLVGALSTLSQTSGNLLISLLATGLIALLFQPLRERLQRGVNHLLYGERDDPYAVLANLGRRLESTLAPDAVLSTIVETVAQALKLPYAAIELTTEDPLASLRTSSGRKTAAQFPSSVVRPPSVVHLPLTYQHESIGTLLLAPRAPGESFSEADLRLLNDFARQAGIAAHAVRLTADVQHSRARLVTAREEERRRIRRDLHDGLGPTLAAQTLKLGAARALLASSPTAADAILADLESDIEQALADIRRLVYALRPPELDQLGLVGAIRESVVQYAGQDAGPRANSDGNRLCIRLDLPERLPPLPAAVEVAAYRIVQEALTNVVRHAQAQQCCIQLRVNGTLQITISDDGVGVHGTSKPGVGLASMRERAAELGGTCIIESASGAGTRILVQLPLVLPQT